MRQCSCTCLRPHVRLCGRWVPLPHRFDGLHECFTKRSRDLACNIDAFDSATALASVEHRAIGNCFGSLGYVSIRPHIYRVLTTEFELRPREDVPGSTSNRTPGCIAARKEYPAQARQARECSTCGRASLCGEEDVLRNASLQQEALDSITCIWCVFARLKQHSVPRNECRSKHIRGDKPRIVPCTDVRNHTEWFILNHLLNTSKGPHRAWLQNLVRALD
mmetsp:Transcript_3575/g.12425  ORF Transcript_3575/g.12425 Transcript_3575/m.12425 type:complete len:220 (-) Transcript_3575:428-1087(-)